MEICYHITEICNLNCVGCFHYLPISNIKKHYHIEKIKYELKLLAKHSKIVHNLVIMGGEPTLHPDIVPILYYAREIFPNTTLTLATNGAYYKIFDEKSFIRAIKYNNIAIRITQYPFSENAKDIYTEIYEKLNKHGIGVETVSVVDTNYHFLKQSFHKDLINDITENKHCKTFHYCATLRDTKLYICNFAAYIDSLLDKFPEIDWIETDNNSYVDLTEDYTNEQILEKLSKLSVVCTHCIELNRGWISNNPDEITERYVSEQKKEEWVKE